METRRLNWKKKPSAVPALFGPLTLVTKPCFVAACLLRVEVLEKDSEQKWHWYIAANTKLETKRHGQISHGAKGVHQADAQHERRTRVDGRVKICWMAGL